MSRRPQQTQQTPSAAPKTVSQSVAQDGPGSALVGASLLNSTQNPEDLEFPLWRMKHPTSPNTYYSSASGEWVVRGEGLYTIWTNADWKGRFGVNDKERQWESFGYRIPLYDNEEEVANATIN